MQISGNNNNLSFILAYSIDEIGLISNSLFFIALFKAEGISYFIDKPSE